MGDKTGYKKNGKGNKKGVKKNRNRLAKKSKFWRMRMRKKQKRSLITSNQQKIMSSGLEISILAIPMAEKHQGGFSPKCGFLSKNWLTANG